MSDNQNGTSQTGIFTAWLKQPFSEQMSALGWFLFLGFALIVAFFWKQVLNHIVEAA